MHPHGRGLFHACKHEVADNTQNHRRTDEWTDNIQFLASPVK